MLPLHGIQAGHPVISGQAAQIAVKPPARPAGREGQNEVLLPLDNHPGHIVHRHHLRRTDETAAAALQESYARAGEEIAVAGELGEAFDRIVGSISNVQDQAATISRETGKQVELCRTAMTAVASINGLAGENSAPSGK